MKNVVRWGVFWLALTTAGHLTAQGPGTCPVAADGTCTVRDGTPCKTTPGLPKNNGTCKSTTLGHGDIVGQCTCIATAAPTPAATPEKGDGGGATSLFVFLILFAAWVAVKTWPGLGSAHRK